MNLQKGTRIKVKRHQYEAGFDKQTRRTTFRTVQEGNYVVILVFANGKVLAARPGCKQPQVINPEYIIEVIGKTA